MTPLTREERGRLRGLVRQLRHGELMKHGVLWERAVGELVGIVPELLDRIAALEAEPAAVDLAPPAIFWDLSTFGPRGLRVMRSEHVAPGSCVWMKGELFVGLSGGDRPLGPPIGADAVHVAARDEVLLRVRSGV